MKRIKISLIFLLLIMPLCSVGFAQSQSELYKSILSSYKSQNYNKCIELSSQYVKKYSREENIKIVKLLLGISYLKIGEKGKAIQIFEAHNKRYPNYSKNVQIKFLLGKLYYEKKAYSNAKIILKQLIESYPSSKYTSKAEELLNSIEKMRPKITKKIKYDEIIEAYKQKDYQKVYDLSDAFIRQNPNSEKLPLVYYINGVSATKLQNYNDGIDSFSTIINKFPQFNKYDMVFYLRAYCYYKNNQFDNAKADLKVLKNHYPNSKLINKADSLLDKIETDSNSRVAKSTSLSKTRYSFSKITWAKITAGTVLIASPIFLALANSYQKDSDYRYDNKYMNATSEGEAIAYWNQVVDKDKQAANFRTYSLISLFAGIGSFAIDYFLVGRVPLNNSRLNAQASTKDNGLLLVKVSNFKRPRIRTSYTIKF